MLLELLVHVLSSIKKLAKPVHPSGFDELNLSVHADELHECHNACLPIGVLLIEIVNPFNDVHPLLVDLVLLFKEFCHVLGVHGHLMLDCFLLLVKVL